MKYSEEEVNIKNGKKRRCKNNAEHDYEEIERLKFFGEIIVYKCRKCNKKRYK